MLFLRNRAADAEAASASADSLEFNPFDAAIMGDVEPSNNPSGNNPNPNTSAARRRNSSRRPAPVLPLSKVYAKYALS